MGLGWDCESEEIQFTTKMQHGHHYKTRGIKYAGLHLGDEGQRKQQITGQLHRAGIEIEGQHRYGSIGKGDYDWKYRMLGNQGRLLVEDIKVYKCCHVTVVQEMHTSIILVKTNWGSKPYICQNRSIKCLSPR